MLANRRSSLHFPALQSSPPLRSPSPLDADESELEHMEVIEIPVGLLMGAVRKDRLFQIGIPCCLCIGIQEPRAYYYDTEQKSQHAEKHAVQLRRSVESIFNECFPLQQYDESLFFEDSAMDASVSADKSWSDRLTHWSKSQIPSQHMSSTTETIEPMTEVEEDAEPEIMILPNDPSTARNEITQEMPVLRRMCQNSESESDDSIIDIAFDDTEEKHDRYRSHTSPEIPNDPYQTSASEREDNQNFQQRSNNTKSRRRKTIHSTFSQPEADISSSSQTRRSLRLSSRYPAPEPPLSRYRNEIRKRAESDTNNGGGFNCHEWQASVATDAEFSIETVEPHIFSHIKIRPYFCRDCGEQMASTKNHRLLRHPADPADIIDNRDRYEDRIVEQLERCFPLNSFEDRSFLEEITDQDGANDSAAANGTASKSGSHPSNRQFRKPGSNHRLTRSRDGQKHQPINEETISEPISGATVAQPIRRGGLRGSVHPSDLKQLDLKARDAANGLGTIRGTITQFKRQLRPLGLTIRSIFGDGNCLFRAFSDQLNGVEDFHLEYRAKVTKFMGENADDYAPFITDDVTFPEYVNSLTIPGTYAGELAISAFARIHKVTVVVHKVGQKTYKVPGGGEKQLHLAFHIEGEHYSSVRRIQDGLGTPTDIHIED